MNKNIIPNSYIRSVGSYLPEKCITNDYLSEIVDTSDQWITSRTGIKQRHVVANNEKTSDMATKAAEQALKKARISPEQIDLIIVATTTSDRIFPATATSVQANLKLKNAAAFDLQAVCSGFIYGMHVADSMIKSGNANNILLIGADSMSKLLNWQDRKTCVLFGDGAGAAIISVNQRQEHKGIFASEIYSDGSYANILQTSGGVSVNQQTGTINMSGKEIYKHAVEKMSFSILTLVKKMGCDINEIDYIIPHQANARIIDAIGKNLNIPSNKIIMTVDKHANTSAASIPLALDYAVKNNNINPGNLILSTAFGGGLTWGACLFRW